MYSSVTHTEEITRMDLMVPEIRLKIIHLNLNDRGESLTPPPPAAAEGSVLQRYARLSMVRKRLHKLESYDHLLHQLRQGWPLSTPAEGMVPSQCCSKNVVCAKDSPDEVKDKDRLTDEDSVFRVFMKGIHKLCVDREKILSTILQLLNRHTVSVALKEHLLFGKTKTLSNSSTLNHILLQSVLMAMNELVDEGVLDISRRDMVRLGQCFTFSLFFHKTLRQLGRDTWHNTYAQVFRDAWMSFGCLGAMFIVSSMRK